MAITETDLTRLKGNIDFYHEWLSTLDPMVLNPATNRMVPSFSSFGTSIGPRRVHTRNVGIPSGFIYYDTGFDIPTSGNAGYFFQYENIHQGQGRQPNKVPGDFVALEDLQALPVTTVSAARPNTLGTQIGLSGEVILNGGSSSTDFQFYLARTSANDLLMACNITFADPMPLVIYDLVLTS